MNKTVLSIGAVIAAAALQSGCAQRIGHMHPRAALAERPPCKTDGNCPLWVYVSPKNAASCEVVVAFETVRVAKTWHPTVLWKLDALDEEDAYVYRFHPADGIVIQGNDPGTDFNNGHPSGDDKFSWKSVHGRPKEFKYTVTVQHRLRADHGAQFTDCAFLDPKIVND